MLAKTETVALIGTEARLVQAEVHVSGGLPKFAMVGLPAKSVCEAEQRVRSALLSSDESWPTGRVVANLAPGTLRKEGTHFDLPIALGVLAGDGRIEGPGLAEWVCLGELALNGMVRPVPGTLAAAISCRRAGRRGLICPTANAAEGALIDGIEVVPVDNLRQCIDFFRGGWTPPAVEVPLPEEASWTEDMSDFKGDDDPKCAAEIAAAGSHNLLLYGPPGSGKTMLARRFPGILPEMSMDESLDVTRIYSVAGLLSGRARLIRRRPFRSPHQHISLAGLIGGGSGMARPGEISLAHNGVLFLDELTLYRADVLESLRAPLEDGVVRIARSGGAISYPCRFSLVAAINPCPCGYLGDERKRCTCSPQQLSVYRSKLSGPLLDRFDIQVEVQRPSPNVLMAERSGDSSGVIKDRVQKARARQTERYGSSTITNASAPIALLEDAALITRAAKQELHAAVESLPFSGRGVSRVKRLARTIADLEGAESVERDHIIEAISFRSVSYADAAA